MNPEELFRKIFGDAGFNTSAFGGFSDFAESTFGFAPAEEASTFLVLFYLLCISSSEVLVLLSVWSKVQMICIWSS